ncbi:MAG: hypothetical protein QM534_02320 [Sediminibacterium sp.]|nr:hypothetical protein [Sediminibacterium sp.]
MANEEVNTTCIAFDYAKVVLEDGLIIIEVKPNTILTATKAEEMREACLKLVPESKFLCLVRVGLGTSVDSSIIPYVNNPEKTISKAQAIVLRSSLQTMMANLYIRVMRRINDVKVFTSETEAMRWLNSR